MQTKLSKLEKALQEQPPDIDSSETVKEIGNLKRLIYENISSIRHGFGGLILRRTLNSPGEGGKGKVGNLRPYKEIVALVTLSEQESKRLEDLNQLVAGFEGQESQAASVSSLLLFDRR